MAVIHRTTLLPSKLELLTDWLPRQHWWAGELRGPSLARVGGFRLDDPARPRASAGAEREQYLGHHCARRACLGVTGLWTATNGTLIGSLFATARPVID